MTAFSPPTDVSWVIRQNPSSQAKKDDSRRRAPDPNQLEDPCKKYIEGGEIPIKSTKSLGTDDHFKSAVCSKNLLKVCEKLMVNKEFVKATVDSADDDFEELSLMNEKGRMDYYRKKHGARRASQSLPASPILERKSIISQPHDPVSNNPYFTITKAQPKTESNISFLTNLFGITAKSPAEANANLAKKYEQETMRSDKAKAAFDTKTEDEAQRKRKMTPKQNEYREMNIFSPTSM